MKEFSDLTENAKNSGKKSWKFAKRTERLYWKRL